MAKTKHLLQEFSRADWVTSLAILVATSAIWLLLNGYFNLAIGVVFVSMFLDYVDGVIARKYGGSRYGAILDSLYDTLGWVLFPALTINIATEWAWWSVSVTTLFILFSLMRLARFSVDGYLENDKKYYVGLPVLFSKYALLAVHLWNGVPTILFMLVMTPLMISSVKVPKPHPLITQLELVYAAIFIVIHFSNV